MEQKVRFQLSLDCNVADERRIVEYLQTYQRGANRNRAMVNLMLAGIKGEPIQAGSVIEINDYIQINEKLDTIIALNKAILKGKGTDIKESANKSPNEANTQHYEENIQQEEVIKKDISDSISGTSKAYIPGYDNSETISDDRHLSKPDEEFAVPDNILAQLNSL